MRAVPRSGQPPQNPGLPVPSRVGRSPTRDGAARCALGRLNPRHDGKTETYIEEQVGHNGPDGRGQPRLTEGNPATSNRKTVPQQQGVRLRHLRVVSVITGCHPPRHAPSFPESGKRPSASPCKTPYKIASTCGYYTTDGIGRVIRPSRRPCPQAIGERAIDRHLQLRSRVTRSKAHMSGHPQRVTARGERRRIIAHARA